MSRVQYLFVCFMCYFVFQSRAGPVSFITPCKGNDKPCLLANGQKALPFFIAGIPELGVNGVDPMKIDSVKSQDNNLKLEFYNINILGLNKAKILNIERDVEKQTIKVDLETGIDATGQYDLNGKLLILDARGNGDFRVNTKKVVVHTTLKYKTIEKQGNKYWKITGFDYSYDLVEKVYIRLDNLFGGNKELAKPISELLDREWKLLVSEIGDPLIKEVVEQYVHSVKQFFLTVPAKDLEVA